MNEDFLHYVWKFQKVNTQQLKTSTGELLQVIQVGQHNYNSGPDFFNGQVIIGTQKWAGTIEIHIKSSHWYAHNHQTDTAYDTVILHVVWQHDTEIYRSDGTQIPVLEIKSFIASEILKNYTTLFSEESKWINCQNNFATIDNLIVVHWLERLYIERLEQKSKSIEERLKQLNTNWEAVLFEMLAKNFGLNVNGDSFLSIAQSLPFKLIQKNRQSPLQLESLLMGQAGFFNKDNTDSYFTQQQIRYAYLLHKYRLKNKDVIAPRFFRLRPPNFPTIRISQLSNLYCMRQHLFSDIVAAKKVTDYYSIFNISALPYWEAHFNFGVTATPNKRKLTKPFIDLLIINTLIPIMYCYAKYTGKDNLETLIAVSRALPKERNNIIDQYNALKKTATNAFDSQALIQLKKQYCEPLRCMHCAIGNSILSKKC